MTSRELFKLGFRIAEAIYRQPGQPVKSESEIMAEFPDIPAPCRSEERKLTVADCQVLNLKELHES